MISTAARERTVRALEDRLGYRFENIAWLQQALTHRSAASAHNERLEFLGDGALNFIIAAALFERCPDAPEGDLSRLRAALVRERTLAEVAAEIDLGDALVLGPGEQRDGSYRRDSIRADGVEAVLGAIYCDGGFAAVQASIRQLFSERLDNLPDPGDLKDPKTRLQEWLQARGRRLPEYVLLRVSGADHCQHFVASCGLSDSDEQCEGEGAGRRAAEQQAARRMLALLGESERDK